LSGNHDPYRRQLVVLGTAGMGKSTLAGRLFHILMWQEEEMLHYLEIVVFNLGYYVFAVHLNFITTEM
jgi:hypothetical protein